MQFHVAPPSQQDDLYMNKTPTPPVDVELSPQQVSYHTHVKNRVTWPIEPQRCALLIHDMQPHYLKIVNEPQRKHLIANVNTISAACVERQIPIFASQVLPVGDVAERGLMLDMWGKGPEHGNHAIDPSIGLSDGEFRYLVKRSYSAFYGNDFDVLLRRLRRDELIVVGVYTSIGCRISAVDAFMRDIRVFLVSDATADMSEADHEIGLRSAAHTCARIVSSENVLQELRR